MTKGMNKIVRSFFGNQWTAVLIGNILLFIVLAVFQSAFLRPQNLVNILCQCSLYGIMSIGMTFVISTGGIDISVGMHAFFAMCLMFQLNKLMPAWLVFIVVLIIGIIVGTFNGFLASVLNFPDMIATLASMSVLRGAGYLLIGQSAKQVDPVLRIVGGSKIADFFPIATLIMLVVGIAGHWVLRNTRFGRFTLAVGGNKNSAKLTGINVHKVKMGAYAVCGFCAAMAGIVYAGRVGTIQPDSCLGYEFTVITAVVLGGTKMRGGKSSIIGSILGCVFLYLVENAMTMLSISSYYQEFVRGIMMLCAIAIDTLTTYRQNAAMVRDREKRILDIN